MQFRDFLVVLRARWRTIAACALIVLGATAAYTLTLTPSYTATARIYFSATSPDIGATQSRGVYVITSQDLNTYIEVLRSPAVVDPLRTELSLPAGAALNLSASVPPQASVLDITAVDGTAEGAARIANAVGPQLAQVAAKFSPLLASAGQTVEATTITPAVAPDAPFSPERQAQPRARAARRHRHRDRCGLRPARPRHPGPLGGGPQGDLGPATPLGHPDGQGHEEQTPHHGDRSTRHARGVHPPTANEPALRGRHDPKALVRGDVGDVGRGKDHDRRQPGHGVGRHRRPRARSWTATCATRRSRAAWAWRVASG